MKISTSHVQSTCVASNQEQRKSWHFFTEIKPYYESEEFGSGYWNLILSWETKEVVLFHSMVFVFSLITEIHLTLSCGGNWKNAKTSERGFLYLFLFQHKAKDFRQQTHMAELFFKRLPTHRWLKDVFYFSLTACNIQLLSAPKAHSVFSSSSTFPQ